MTTKELRVKSQLSIESVARKTGMTVNKIFRLDHGNYIPNALEVYDLASLYNVPVRDIILACIETQEHKRKKAQLAEMPV